MSCDGTACLTSVKSEKVRASMAERFNDAGTGSISCLGQCHTKNAFMIDNVTCAFSGRDGPDDILNTAFPPEPVFSLGTNAERPALLVPYGELNDYYGIIGKYTCVIYVRDENPGAVNSLRNAIVEFE